MLTLIKEGEANGREANATIEWHPEEERHDRYAQDDCGLLLGEGDIAADRRGRAGAAARKKPHRSNLRRSPVVCRSLMARFASPANQSRDEKCRY
jgi:hypothetical protein